MSNRLSDSSTLDEVCVEILAGRVDRFDEIPVHHQSGLVAKKWLIKKAESHSGDLDCYYQEVPIECRSEQFMICASLYGCSVLKDTVPDQNGIYLGLARLALLNDYNALIDVHPDFMAELLEQAYEDYQYKMHLIIHEIEWVNDMMSDEYFEKCCYGDVKFALEASPGRRIEDLSTYLNLEDSSIYGYLRGRGRLDALSARISKGCWPKEVINNIPHIVKPGTLSDGILQLKEAKSVLVETVLMAFVMSYPIEQVFAIMDGVSLKKLLIEMYPEETLASYLKDDNQLKGAFLEDAFGL